MRIFKSVPVTAAVFSAAATLLSGCIAYNAASTVVGAGVSVAGATAHVASDVVTLPFDNGSDAKTSK